MNENKSMYYMRQILKLLIESNELITTSQVSIEMNITEKTVRAKIDQINHLLKEYNFGQICKKRRVGIWLDATDNQIIEIQQYFLNQEKVDYTQNDQSRMYTALKLILNSTKNNRLTTAKLADEMFLSVPTVLKVVKDCKDWLKLFQIDLKLVRNKGFELTYNESQLRIAMKHFILKLESPEKVDERILSLMPMLDIDNIKALILKTEEEWGVEFAEESFNEIYVYLCVFIARSNITIRKKIEIPVNELRMLQSYNEYGFAEMLIQRTSLLYKVEIDVNEIAFLSIPILCSKIIDPTYNSAADEIIRQYDDKLQSFVHTIISVVSKVLNVDLTQDEILFNGLLVHLKPAIFRLRYEKTQTNALKNYIKSEYKYAFRVSWLIAILFEKHFELAATEDELSYITLYIQSSLERNQKSISAILVTQTSMGINQMLVDKIERTFTQLNIARVVSYHDYIADNYKNYDLVITTKSIENTSQNTIAIDDLLSEKSIQNIRIGVDKLKKIRGHLTSKFDVVCHSLFEADLIMLNLTDKNKEQVIKKMTDKLLEKAYVTQSYYQSVLDREKHTPTSIGNMVAIPHGDQYEINEAKVVIATLNEAIIWDSEYVNVVFLLAVKMTNDYEIEKTQKFYSSYIKLVDTDTDVDIIRTMKTNEQLYEYLIK